MKQVIKARKCVEDVPKVNILCIIYLSPEQVLESQKFYVLDLFILNDFNFFYKLKMSVKRVPNFEKSAS